MNSMKFFLIIFACLIFSNISVGQSIILKTDTIPFGTDSLAVLRLPDYRGEVNWQVSYDKNNWHDLTQLNRDSIIVDKDVDAWYRAEVSDGTCTKVYSDTVIIQKSDTFEITPFVPIQDIHGNVEGEPVRVIFNNDTITCVKDSNEYIFQGDIVLSEEEIRLLNSTKGASVPFSLSGKLWPERLVYYSIPPDFPDKERVTNAIRHWEFYTKLKFINIEDAPDQPNFIEFVSYKKTDSRVGMVGGKQLIRVDPDCDEHGVRHEIGHAIGLHHEHSRADRDKYIIVHEDNIIEGAEHNYRKIENSVSLGEFDYVSLMLYFNTGSFARDPKKPILERRDGGVWQDDLVQRKLSRGDIAMVNYLYSTEPFVKTAGVTEFKDNAAISGGNVYNDGGSMVTSKGICWNTTGDPEVGLENSSDNGEGIGSFRAVITNLEPNKTYYVRAYAKNKNGIGYGNQIVFENDPSVSLPLVYTKPIDVRIYFNIDGKQDSVKTYVLGHVVNDGGSPVTERGGCWNNSGNVTTADETKIDSQTGTGKYIIKIADYIAYDVQYSLKAYANNKKGTSYGDEIVFTVHPFEEDFPSIRTNGVAVVTGNSAKCGGIISTGNVPTFSSRGVFYGTHNNPTVLDQIADIGAGGSGSFEVNLTGLQSGKLYYARAFAVTERGTLYGNVVSFTTASGGYLTDTFIDERDGNEYTWVQIGEQTWMAENLAYLPSVNSPSSDSSTEPLYYVYNYDSTDVSIAKAMDHYSSHGALYNWPAALIACPEGWHLPSDEEWKQMEKSLGMADEELDKTSFRGIEEGIHLKSPLGWIDDVSGTNSSGFAAIPAGYRFTAFNWMGAGLAWWTSTPDTDENAWDRGLSNQTNRIDRWAYGKNSGFSIRCIKDSEALTLPSVTTKSISGISQNSATGGGEITFNGGASVTARGVCWNTTGSPSINDNKTSGGQGIGSFVSTLDGLTAHTTYYVRAYATNSQGTAYGNEVTFTTTEVATTGTFIDERDNHEYRWVQIGEQTWMVENLAWLPAVNPSAAGSDSDPYYYVYGYDGMDVSAAKTSENYPVYGALYNWPAALSACPTGWHLPSDEEWTTLVNYLINNGYGYEGSGDDIAKSMASTSSNWIITNRPGCPGNEPANNDSSGFSGHPGGARYGNSSFLDLGINSYWWSASQTWALTAWFRNLNSNSTGIYRDSWGTALGFSVRCVKD